MYFDINKVESLKNNINNRDYWYDGKYLGKLRNNFNNINLHLSEIYIIKYKPKVLYTIFINS